MLNFARNGPEICTQQRPLLWGAVGTTVRSDVVRSCRGLLGDWHSTASIAVHELIKLETDELRRGAFKF